MGAEGIHYSKKVIMFLYSPGKFDGKHSNGKKATHASRVALMKPAHQLICCNRDARLILE